MANWLKAAKVASILELHHSGWTQRRIARTLGISRDTVASKIREAEVAAAAAALSGSNQATAPTGSASESGASNQAIAPTGSRSLCAPWREQILAKLEQGLSAQRIHQDLATEHGFAGGYPSVRRYVAQLGRSQPLPFRRWESEPGEEAQIDFGQGAPVVGADGVKRRPHVLRVVLSCSRKAYSEATFRQTTDNLIRILENAFEHFGGVPRTLVSDNLKAAVLRADWYDPDVTPKLQSFCEHYGIVLLPTKPRTPRHKGKVERGVAYVQDNALKARVYASLEEQNAALRQWETTIADTRIHGTTRQQVGRLFEELERGALRPLPKDRFAHFHEAQRKVSRDAHVAVGKAYYSVPPEYLGHTLWVRWDLRMVRIYDEQLRPICVHALKPPGKFSTHPEHLASEKISAVERGLDWQLAKIALVGAKTHAWAVGCVAARGVQASRVLQGLMALTRKHRSELIEGACDTAHANQCYRLQSLRRLLGRAEAKQGSFEFLEDHRLIRNLAVYGEEIRVCLETEKGSL